MCVCVSVCVSKSFRITGSHLIFVVSSFLEVDSGFLYFRELEITSAV